MMTHDLLSFVRTFLSAPYFKSSGPIIPPDTVDCRASSNILLLANFPLIDPSNLLLVWIGQISFPSLLAFSRFIFSQSDSRPRGESQRVLGKHVTPSRLFHHRLEEHDVRPTNQVCHHTVIMNFSDSVIDQYFAKA